jgi:hypothetical protein
MPNRSYNIHANCYIYDCANCNIKVCNILIDNELCHDCLSKYDAELNQLKIAHGIIKFKYEHMEGEPAVIIENRLNHFNKKVIELNKKYNF